MTHSRATAPAGRILKALQWCLLLFPIFSALGCGSSELGLSSIAPVSDSPIVDTPVAPVALADSYTVSGNTVLQATSGQGVLVNDTGIGATIITHTEPSNGQLVLETDGSFIYTPSTGFRGPTDSFDYTLRIGELESTTTVTLNIDGMTWYVDNSRPELGADGSESAPFPRLALSEGVSQTGDTILVFFGTGATYDSITLKDNQSLFGETGRRPIISNTTGVAITLANNNSVRGLAVNNTPGDAILGRDIDGLSLDDVASVGSGEVALHLLDFSGDILLENLSFSGSGDNAIELQRPSGANLTLRDSMIEQPEKAGLRVSGNVGGLTGTFTGNTILRPGTDGLNFVGSGSASFDLVIGGTANGNTIVDVGRLGDFESAIGLSCDSGPNRILVLDNTLQQSVVTNRSFGIVSSGLGVGTTSQILIDGNRIEGFNAPNVLPARILYQQNAHVDLGFTNNTLVNNSGGGPTIQCLSGGSACVRFNDNDYSANPDTPRISNGSSNMLNLETTSGNLPVGPVLELIVTEVSPGSCVDVPARP